MMRNAFISNECFQLFVASKCDADKFIEYVAYKVFKFLSKELSTGEISGSSMNRRIMTEKQTHNYAILKYLNLVRHYLG